MYIYDIGIPLTGGVTAFCTGRCDLSTSTQDRRKEVRAWLRPGRIMLLQNDFAATDKFLIVASSDPELLCFAINSRVNPFIQERPSLLRCQVPLKQEDHRHFLRVSSYADCSTVIDVIPIIKAVSQLVADASRRKGQVTDTEREAIIRAIDNAGRMPTALKERLLKEWSAV